MKRSKHPCDLKSCSFCRQVLPEWKSLLDLNRQTFSLRKGERLFSEGDPVAGVFFLENGRAKVHQHWTDDKELILRFAGPGSIVGHRGLGKEPVYPVSATALEPCTICFIPLSFFYSTLRVNHELMLQMMLFFAEELRESEQRMRNMARLPVKSRVAGALIFLQEKFGVDTEGFIDLPFSRQDLAAYVGATYETVFRMLQELVGANLVVLEGKGVRVCDAVGLALLAGGVGG